jgi:cell fate regulator YaaT (PSP1 superfamily)
MSPPDGPPPPAGAPPGRSGRRRRRRGRGRPPEERGRPPEERGRPPVERGRPPERPRALVERDHPPVERGGGGRPPPPVETPPEEPRAPAAEPPERPRAVTAPPPREPPDPDGEDVFAAPPDDAQPERAGLLTNVAGIKFRPAGTIYEYDAGELAYPRGARVVVETERGPVLATIAVAAQRVPTLEPLRRILRAANAADARAEERNSAREREAFLFCKQRIRERRLPMKLVRVELPLVGQKALFYFASEERVDFRELVKDLAQRLHGRIEMRQIGARDEAKMVGGIGSCGRELCCSTWLPAFVPISIKAAKDQGLVLNPSKLAGQCGRLKCCLVYEHDTYRELSKSLPKVGKRVSTPAGDGKVVELDVLRQRVRVWFEEGGSQSFPASVVTLKGPPSTVDS